ncbi:MAG: hypothetical protein WKG01_31465 [Kofleriaceae bacterium]
MIHASLVVALLLVACKDDARPRPVEPVPEPPTAVELAAHSALVVDERPESYVVRDASGLSISLPGRPKLAGKLVTQGSEQAFLAEADVRGPLDLQFAVLTMRAGALPAEVAKLVEGAALALVQEAGGGELQRNRAGQLAGQPAHLFELVTRDRRRVLGWYIVQHGRMIQLHCSGPDTDVTRVDCDQIASTLRLATSEGGATVPR